MSVTERGEVTLDEASETLKVSEATVRRLIADKVLTAAQYCKGAPWVIRADDLQDENVKQAANARRQRRPASADQRQNVSAI
ncbi:MAG: helix-turn-helix domain-containing protein [Allosphingosinicella sp.]